MSAPQPPHAAGSRDPRAVLRDLPDPLWDPLLRAFRRAVDRLERAELPASVRPFARWRPERLSADRPRAAVAAALVSEPRLRAALGEAAARPEALAAAGHVDPLRLAADHGEGPATVALVAGGRWQELTVLAAAVAERTAAHGRAGAEQAACGSDGAGDLGPEPPRTGRGRGLPAAASRALADARREADAQRRRAEAAGERAERDRRELQRLQARIAQLEAQLDELRAQLEAERRGSRARRARLLRRAERVEGQRRVDRARALRVAEDLERLASDLRVALNPPHLDSGDDRRPDGATPPAGVPRAVPPAAAGRPSRLPAGLAHDDPAAVHALLQVPGLEVLVDGYNVSKDARGQPHTSLEEQRLWLLRVAAAVVGRYQRRVSVVFDSSDPQAAPTSSPRGVRIVYSAAGETADERILSMARADRQAPLMVVTSDRELADAAAGLGANVVAARTFLDGMRA